MHAIHSWAMTKKFYLLPVAIGLLLAAKLQAEEQAGKIDRTIPATTVTEKVDEKKAVPPQNPVKEQEPAGQNANSQAKRVGSAVINLQTTVTGNQEQPRVMYILPWQSPAPEDVDFESLENQTKSVFGHIERDELRRELESLEKKTK